MLGRFGHYELHRRIGGGGMADVYAARRPTKTGPRVCALKLIRPESAQDPNYRRLFLREGKLAMRVDSPRVVSVFDVGEYDGMLFMEMELVDGVSLDRFLERVRRSHPDRPSLAEAIYIVTELLLALHNVHTHAVNQVEQRIVHRDVSPQNVLVSSTGDIKLTDFGIARRVDGQITDRVYGKLSYMPREQYMGHPAQQSDLFAVGAIFYELLTGRKLREGCRTRAELHEALTSEEHFELPTGLPRKVFETLAGLLVSDPKRRTSTAKEALRHLGNEPRTGMPQLDIADIYIAAIGNRHSWYTDLMAMANRPVAEPPPRIERTSPGRRSRKTKKRRKDVKAGDERAAAPVQVRPWERAQEHHAAIDDVTTVPWKRKLWDGPTAEVRS